MLILTAGITPVGDVASRELGWNMGGTPGIVIMYLMALIAFVIFGVGLHKRIQHWKLGKPLSEGFSDWGARIWILFRETVFQNQTRRRFLPGLFHSLIFYSFIILFITTLIVMAQMDFGVDFFHGKFYLIVSLLADLAGACLLLGVIIAAIRRFAIKPDFLPETKPIDMFILLIIGLLGLTGFIAEGVRIRFYPGGDPWSEWTPVGAFFATMVGGIGESTGLMIHSVTWWIHAVLTFTLIAMVPYTKFMHMLAIPTNQLLSKLEARGTLKRMDIEALFAADDVDDDVVLGIAEGQHLSWKQRFDGSACIECGRCDDVCPARAAEQPLSPRSLICDLRDMLTAAAAAGGDAQAGGAIQEAENTVFADTDFIWHCRTCHACTSICPAAINHVDLFFDLRRSETMMEARMPGEAATAMKTMETQGNPFGSQAERMDFVEKLNIPILSAGDSADYLLWFGCCTSFDPEKHRIAEDLVAILKHAKVSFGHLGRDETCCGDPARLIGEENLFQMTAKETVESIKTRKFKQMLVICPHCYNVFQNEYSQFGGEFDVIHHTELLAQLLDEGKIKLTEPVRETVTYHDPCYLGRYQGIYAPARKLLNAVPGVQFVEMKNTKAESACCGAGGGHYWMELDKGDERVHTNRVDEATAVGADTIAAGCSYCYQMLVDGLKARDIDERMKIDDVVNIVRKSMAI
jgi:Fe-S oxidoreductase/nitrate reductase gamma subunit